MNKLRVLELFAGIGACSKALEKLGIEHEIVDAVEIDKYAVKSFNAIHNTNFEPQDITQWDKDIEVDLVMHGSPCQDFSLAGLQAGGDEGSGTRSSLMYETIRIVEKLKPKYVIWENVKNLLSKKHKHNFDAYIETMEKLGYKNYYQVLNAKDYGIPQNRERVFTISIRNDIDKEFVFPEKQELKLRLKDMLEDEVDEKYYLSDRITSFFIYNEQQQIEKGNGFRFNVTDGNVVAKTITTRAGSRMDDNFIGDKEMYKNAYIRDFGSRGRVQKDSIQTLTTQNNLGVCVLGNYSPSGHEASRIVDNEGIAPTVKENHGTVTATQDQLRIRKLTPKECWRLMGFDDSDYDKASQVNSNAQLYKQAGNSIVVNVLMAIFNELLKKEGE
jgi:DNA (cytosine-5)-methyltransferase 1